MSNTVKQTLWMLPSDLADAASRYARTLPADERDAFVDAMMRTSFALDVRKSDAEITEYYAKADQESTRPLGVSGSGVNKVGHTFVTCGIDERVTADTLSDETADSDNVVHGESMRVTVADLYATARISDDAGRSKFTRLIDAIGKVEWNDVKGQPNLVQLSKVLGVSRATARESLGRLTSLLRATYGEVTL